MPFNNMPPRRPLATDPNTLDLIDLILLCINEHMQNNQNRKAAITYFCSVSIPNISIRDYLKRCVYYLEFHETNLIAMFIYLDRYLQNTPTDFIHPLNIHRLLFSLLRLTNKFIDDYSFDAKSCASIAGIAIKELNQLEIDLLARLNFDLYISHKQYLTSKAYLATLARKQEQQGSKKYLFSLSPEEEANLKDVSMNELYQAPDAVEPIINQETDEENVQDLGASAASSAAAAQSKPSPIPQTFFSTSPKAASAPSQNTIETNKAPTDELAEPVIQGMSPRARL